MTGRARSLVLAASVLAAMLLTASAPASSPALTAASGDATGPVYLSIGDSYAAGFQPEPIGSSEGFAQQIAHRSASSAEPLRLVNLGCPGATTSAVLEDVGCPTADTVTDGLRYPASTQMAAALEVMRSHAGEIRLVTVSLGGNDINACLRTPDPVGCTRDATPTIGANVRTVLREVRSVVGPNVPIVGITYPDIYLRDVVSDDPQARARAKASVTIMRDLLNPTLADAYSAAGAGFVDITNASGAYGSTEQTVTLSDGTQVPAAVAVICQYTHYCEKDDPHPTTAGYSFIADQVLALLAANDQGAAK